MDNELREKFLSDSRGLVVAPAGYGKTCAIAECISICPNNQCQLLLTHTHAGIASIRAKLMELRVNPVKYHISTISGFAQRYVLAFCDGDSLPDQDDKEYFNVIIRKAQVLFHYSSIQSVILNSYQGMFVDEYQDCTIDQHSFLMVIASILPTHIFGDPLQGIFGFGKESLVDFDECLSSFSRYSLLDTPWRWKSKGNCMELGYAIIEIRTELERKPKSVSLSNNDQSQIIVETFQGDFHKNDYSNLKKLIGRIIKENPEESILIIIPNYDEQGRPITAAMRSRIRLRFDFENRFSLIEAIDDHSFYILAQQLDDIIVKIKSSKKKYKKILDLLEKLSFNKTDLKQYISDDRIINKRDAPGKAITIIINKICEDFFTSPNYSLLLSIIQVFQIQCHFVAQRHELYHSTMHCIEKAISNNSTVSDEMRDYKNIIRQTGRRPNQYSVGTTLLTKGLEFDNVIVLGANLINDYKNFYVAISRACKRLFLFANDTTVVFH